MEVPKLGVFLLLLASTSALETSHGFETGAGTGEDFQLDGSDGFAYDYDDYDYEAPPCSTAYYDDDSSEQCHHDKFPEGSLQDVFSSKVKTCCADHGYIFNENCPVSTVDHF